MLKLVLFEIPVCRPLNLLPETTPQVDSQIIFSVINRVGTHVHKKKHTSL